MFTFPRTLLLAVALGLACSIASGQAQITWKNTGTDWNLGTNWNGNVVPGAGNVAAFSAAGTVVNPILGTNGLSVLGISIDNSNADYSILQSNTRTLAIGASGITITGGGVTTIAPRVDVSSTQTWTTGTTDLTLSGGLNMASTGAVLSLSGTSTLVKVTGSVTTTTPNSSVIRLNGDGAMEISGSLSAGVMMESNQNFTGSLTLSGNNSGFNTATTIWRGGTLKIASANALGTGASFQIGTASADWSGGVNVVTTGAYTVARNVFFTDGNNLDVGGRYVLGGEQTSGTSIYSGSINLGTSATSAPIDGLYLTSSSGGVVDFSGQISGSQATAAAGRISKITKIGDGVVRLTGADGNTYTGGTEITAGTLLANNTNSTTSATGTGAVLVGASGTLGGIGYIGNGTTLVTVNGTLSPGDSTTVIDTRDTLTIKGSLTLNTTANTLLQIASLADYDKVSVIGAGAVTLDGTIHLDFATFAASNFASNFTLDVFDWTTVNAAGFSVATDLIFDNVNTGGNLGSWNVADFTTNGSFSWVAVPEPSSLGLLSLGALGLLWRKRRADRR